jgi:putative membrane protein
MRANLTEQERTLLDRRVAEVERRTGAQVVLAVVERSDVYAELPWKAFALGAGLVGLVVVLVDLFRSAWITSTAVLIAVAVTLIAGAAASALCITVPVFARLFLDRTRAEVETRQYAESLFLSRELFATRQRSGVLLLVSMFERTVVVLPDAGSAKRLGPAGPAEIVASMTAVLATGQVVPALETGLSELERRLAAAVPSGLAGNELPDSVIEEGRP